MRLSLLQFPHVGQQGFQGGGEGRGDPFLDRVRNLVAVRRFLREYPAHHLYLVGDIVDEYDVEEPQVIASENGWIVDGKTHLDDLNDTIDSNLESEEFDTIGGYVFGLFGRQPKIGEAIESDGFRFTVAESDGRRIIKLRIEAADHDAVESEQANESIGK
jgi:hypothetical protein